MATLGGIEDRGIGIDESGIAAIERSARLSGVEITIPDGYEDLGDRTHSAVSGSLLMANRLPRLINVGGGTATTGPNSIDHYFGQWTDSHGPVARVSSAFGDRLFSATGCSGAEFSPVFANWPPASICPIPCWSRSVSVPAVCIGLKAIAAGWRC